MEEKKQEQMIKVYRSGFLGFADTKFKRDFKKLYEDGWRVQSQTATQGALAARPTTMTVVYVR